MIPVQDWHRFETDRDGLFADLGAAVRGPGFFLLKNHTMPDVLLADVFADADPLEALRLLHNPPGTGAENEIGAGAQTEYGANTLLMTDGEDGLQVKPRDGDWTDVPHVPGAYVVNIGDNMMRWTNDICVSTPHRVLPHKRQSRSVAFVVEADPDTVGSALQGTEAPKYPASRVAGCLQSRIDATYAPMGNT